MRKQQCLGINLCVFRIIFGIEKKGPTITRLDLADEHQMGVGGSGAGDRKLKLVSAKTQLLGLKHAKVPEGPADYC